MLWKLSVQPIHILKIIPVDDCESCSVIPPELRPLVPLDGGTIRNLRFEMICTVVLLSNNRLKRLLEIKAGCNPS